MEHIKLLDVGGKFIKKCPVDENDQSLLTIVEEDGTMFAAFLNDEIAEQVVRSCNSHADLLAACKETVRCLTQDVELTDFVEQMKAAIAKAEG